MISLIAVIALALQAGQNAELGYTFTLPDGFVAFPEAKTQPDIVDCWTEGTPTSQNGALVLCIHRLHGVLPREAMKQSDLPPGTQLVSFKWKGFDIQGLHSDTTQSGIAVSVFVAQVPLRREAVQLVVAGPRDQSDRMQAIMSASLGSLEGETNWLSSAERSSRLGKGVGVLFGLALLVTAVRILRRRQSQTA